MVQNGCSYIVHAPIEMKSSRQLREFIFKQL
jgi:hypothetical protein